MDGTHLRRGLLAGVTIDADAPISVHRSIWTTPISVHRLIFVWYLFAVAWLHAWFCSRGQSSFIIGGPAAVVVTRRERTSSHCGILFKKKNCGGRGDEWTHGSSLICRLALRFKELTIYFDTIRECYEVGDRDTLATRPLPHGCAPPPPPLFEPDDKKHEDSEGAPLTTDA